MKFKTTIIKKDLIICGGGMSGICAAIEASRHNLSVALINNRGFFGGNASPEIRVTISGATGTSDFNLYAREGGIIDELLIENRHRNPQGNVYLWYTVIIDALKKEKNIQPFLNTNIDTVNMDEKETHKINSVEGSQSGSEKHFKFVGKMFVDDTGDGTISYLAGAEYMYGREARSKWNEQIAPEVADDKVSLSTLPFYTRDFHKNMPFSLPEFAKNRTEQFNNALKYREVPERIPHDSRYDGYRFQWFYEAGSNLHQIKDDEKIVEEHEQLIMNIWDHIKTENSYDSSNFDFEYISPVVGKRESRRIIGDYIYKEKDLKEQTHFKDAIAYGGWSIDLHAPDGFYSNDLINRHYYLNGLYQIPLRSCYAKGVDNLFVASRCLSFSHVASGTVRLMQTLATIGQAVGAAASVCIENNLKVNEIIEDKYIEEVQQMLLEDDQTIPGIKKRESIITQSSITASSTFDGILESASNVNDDRYSKPLCLNNSLGFVFPYVKENNQLQINVRAIEDTTLCYSVLNTTKKENYGPKDIVFKDSIPINKSKNFVTISLQLGNLKEDQNLFIEIEKNPNLELEVVKDRISGWRMFDKIKNDNGCFCSLETLKQKPFIYNKLQLLPTFIYKTDNYDAKSINNGFIRNENGKPNLWLSDLIDEKTEELIIDLKESKRLNNLKITFDALNPDIQYDNLETIYEESVWNHIVKDYNILVSDNNNYWKQVCSIKGNYKKVNNINLPTDMLIKKIKIELLNTNGYKRFSIVDISLK
jgi:hypothetical protein